MADPTAHEWDLFIAHASEDKDDFVRPLAEFLAELGVRVWYDEFQLKPGESLIATIDRGLARSAFGLLIVSKAFLDKLSAGLAGGACEAGGHHHRNASEA